MNGITIILISAVVLIIGYLGYGRWLAKSWGVDSKALTPAVRMEDGKDFSPASRFTVFAHQFSSICGAGPVQGTIVAMAFGWVPVMLWVLVGGIFFGAVHDFGALYASMKNNGKSLAQLIEKYIGKTGRRLFLIFSWLFCLIVIAAFTSMVASTFKMVPADGGGVDLAKSYFGAAAGTISLLFTFVAIAFGWFCRKFDLKGWKQFVCALVLIVAMFAVGMQFPIYLDTNGWIAITMAYLVFAAAMPIQKLKQPRDYLTTIMMVTMIVAAVLGIFAMGVNGQAEMTAPAFVGFTNASGQFLFPVLFVSVACGALSGFHSLVSSGTSSKQVSNEEDALPVGYGAMVLESFVGMLAVVIAAIMYKDMNTGNATPFQIFAGGVAKGVELVGVNATIATVFMTMCVSALALTSLDAVARIARVSLQEFFAKSNDARAVSTEKAGVMKIVGNPWFATVVTLLGGLSLTFGGYLNIWPLFGASNQLLGGMTMITIAVFCKVTGRKGWMLYVPVAFLLCCTFTSLVQSFIGCVVAISTYGLFGTTAAGASVLATSGIQLVFAVLLVILGVIVAYNCLKEFFTKKAGSIPDEEPEWSELGRKHMEESKHDVTVDAKTEVAA
ncbi:MAG: carbon starvation protein A [Olsenella sp.]|jgi:carbon starvation protein|nr:carbon starvation protein A [Olsenella sp.]MCI1793653.1 carbon starvation protein A [Olsenella sp.]MCI1810558.1 carbon starvation protein A [Olsenella sp.]MCI1879019.1 carbon starvation protein A [Olsenella sp.]MCI2155479.1 carbon starvation protein A [Olsenella sp.]